MIQSVELSKDRRLAATVSIGIATITFLVLHFLSYRIPMPPLPEQLKYQDMEAEFIELTPESLPETEASGGGGGGEQVNAPKSDEFQEQMEEVAQTSNSNFSHPSGKSNHTNTTKPTQNGSSTKNPDDNPFNNDGGSGGGSGGGNGGGTGKDDGPDSGPGNGGNGSGTVKRYLVREPNQDKIDSDEDCYITLVVQIGADGSIVGTPGVVYEKTTTSNTALIKRVVSVVKSDAKYNAVKGAANTKKELKLHLTPQ